MTTPVRLVAIGIYDEKGNLRRRIAVDESGQLEEPLTGVDHPQLVYAMIESDNRQIVSVPWMTRHAPQQIENRWAAFTDDEIDLFGNAVQQWPFVARENRQIARTIESEIDAELERRREARELEEGDDGE